MKTDRAAKSSAMVLGFLAALMAAGVLLTAKPAHAETFAVNSTGDAGDQSIGNGFCNTAPFQVGAEPECTLRAAIEEANATTTADTISFNIGGSGVKTISPMTALPDITAPVTIDGYSEPGARPNTLDTGTDAALKIELSGANAAAGTIGLRITGRDSVVKGLIINRFGYGIVIDGTGLTGVGNNKIEGNYIGTDASGTQDLGNSRDGVTTTDAGDTVVGGASTAARNVISGNNLDGILVDDDGGSRIEGNYIGTDASGTADLGNGEDGVTFLNARNNVVGGASASARNVISGNGNDGVTISRTGSGNSANNRVMGNYIGTDASGTADLGNSSGGVVIENASSNTIGGTEPGQLPGTANGTPNVISYNGFHGVAISGETGLNSILSNSIFSNGSLGIDLGANGVTANDPGDADAGPNNLQNFPVITSVTTSSGQTIIKGTLNTNPNGCGSQAFACAIQFFSSPTADPTGFGEGQTLVGETLVTTDSGGDTSFDFALATPLAGGQVVSATATRGSQTSEFSRSVEVEGPPVARDDTYNAREDTTLTRPAPGVLANDSDPDGDPLRASLVSGPKKGKLKLNANGSFTYKPKKDFSGTVSFVYRASDGRGGTDTATATIRIRARPG